LHTAIIADLDSGLDAVHGILKTIPVPKSTSAENEANWTKLAVATLQQRDLVRPFDVDGLFTAILGRAARAFRGFTGKNPVTFYALSEAEREVRDALEIRHRGLDAVKQRMIKGAVMTAREWELKHWARHGMPDEKREANG
jgi:hypothetical protein